MRDVDRRFDSRAGRMEIPRSRGAMSGLLLVLLGLWGALIPFIGPYFNFAYNPDQPWMWTSGRGWLEVLPGAVTVLGGLMLLTSRNRATALFGAWLAVVAGAWFVIGRLFASPLRLGDLGAPVLTSQTGLIALELTFFTGLGALIVALGGVALGRLSVRSVRDIMYAQPSVDEYHRADYERMADRDEIARETADVRGERDDRNERNEAPRERRRGWFGSRHHPVPH